MLIRNSLKKTLGSLGRVSSESSVAIGIGYGERLDSRAGAIAQKKIVDGLAICRSALTGSRQRDLGEEQQVLVVKLLRAFGGCLGTKRR